MSKYFSSSFKNILNALLFQIGWFTCVFGGDFVALIFTLSLLIIHMSFFLRERKEYLAITLFPTVGILAESLLIWSDLHYVGLSYVPIWLACLWVLVGLTLFHSLRWLGTTPALSVALSLLAPPISYYFGGKAVGFTFSSPFTSLMLISVIWGVILPNFVHYARTTHTSTLKSRIYQPKKLILTLLLSSVFALYPYNTVNANTGIHAPPYVIGVARGSDKKTIIYQEHHFKHPNNIEEVRYISPDNKILAIKFIDYKKSLINPSFQQKNTLAKEVSQAYWQDNKLHVIFGPNDSSPDKAIISDFLPNDEKFVIDAGFDHFIRLNWYDLVKGKRIEYDFLLASRFRTFGMYIKQTACKKLSLEPNSLLDNKDICFTTDLTNPLLRIITDPIYLRYDSSTQNLVQFIGISNINDVEGNSYNVNITYTYPLPKKNNK